MLKTISVFCNLREKILIFIYLFFQLIISLFEFITLSLIPLFILYIEDSEKAIIQLEHLRNYFNTNFFQLEINNLILSAFIFMIFALIIKNILQIFISFLEAYIIKILVYSNTSKVFTNFINQNLTYIISQRSSDFLRRITTDVSKAIGYLICVLIICKEAILLSSILLAIFVNNITIGIFTLTLVSLLLLVILTFLNRKLKKKGKKSLESKTNIIEAVTNFIGIIKEIKIYKIENFFLNYFFKNLRIKLKNDMFKHIVSKIPRNIIEIFLIIFICCVLYFLNYSSSDSNNILPTLGLFVVAMFRVIPIVTSINQSYAGLTYNKAIYLNIKNSIKSLNSSSEVNFKYENRPLIKEFKKLSFSNLNFSYDQTKLFKKFNFFIKKNKINGIIGKSGSGKSTLLNIIIGLIKPQIVDIKIDEKKLENKNYKLDGIIGYVPQDIFLINGTILENIALGIDKKKLDKDRINDIARDTCIIEMFKNSNLNYECLVSDRGLNLSGGQRQRIGIARALYRDPDYLILDEATNQLDNKTKIKILENIKLKYNNITTIIVSHDEDIKKICDNIIILDI